MKNCLHWKNSSFSVQMQEKISEKEAFSKMSLKVFFSVILCRSLISTFTLRWKSYKHIGKLVLIVIWDKNFSNFILKDHWLMSNFKGASSFADFISSGNCTGNDNLLHFLNYQKQILNLIIIENLNQSKWSTLDSSTAESNSGHVTFAIISTGSKISMSRK